MLCGNFFCGLAEVVNKAHYKHLHYSVSWLQRRFWRLCLARRPKQYGLVRNCILVNIDYILILRSENDLVVFVSQKELRTSNSCIGYRSIWKLIREKYDLITKRHIDSLCITIIMCTVSNQYSEDQDLLEGNM